MDYAESNFAADHAHFSGLHVLIPGIRTTEYFLAWTYADRIGARLRVSSD